MRKYETLSDYTLIAKKCIKKLYPSVAKEIFQDNDAFGEIVTAIATADWRWDNNRVGKNTGKHKSRYSYRNQCAIWAIKTYVSNRGKKRNTFSIDSSIDTDTDNYYSLLHDNKSCSPLDQIIQREEDAITKNSIKELFDSNILTEKQINQIKLYYFENKTLSQIGNIYGVTREAIRQNIKKGICSIKELADVPS